MRRWQRGRDDSLTDCRNAFCGDGLLHAGVEAAMTAMKTMDGCLNTRTRARCGDGVRRQDRTPEAADYEACDDGNRSEMDGCCNDCSVARLRRWGAAHRSSSGRTGPGAKLRTMATQPRMMNASMTAYSPTAATDTPELASRPDDGNEDDRDACRNSCGRPLWGWGSRRDLTPLEAGYEACEDGTALTQTAVETTAIDVCGDGVLRLDRAGGADGLRPVTMAMRCKPMIVCWIAVYPAGDGWVHEGVEAATTATTIIATTAPTLACCQGMAPASWWAGRSCDQLARDFEDHPSGVYWLQPGDGEPFSSLTVTWRPKAAVGLG